MSWLGSFFSGSKSNSGNDFIGQLVELGDQRVQVRKVIAEGMNIFLFNITYIKKI